ncbi:HSP20-like chaperone [Aaosphaeria arxii CBS 175.79]|uniref:HSP20-like chaperone n=1 Tax=Aaosphaeria arxii CBS 175.79 TaxID=1450172 RepID=A0A6A5Y099_9PLEO|nr:HSP20-like chaperone [Aaosphaeria arxii CBS 175.79]KAF2018260.1 HSP20-like chaperone [Aaosphaeria arxii CBS 175.79]
MAFFLTPRFAPAYQQQACSPFNFCAPVQRPSYRRVVSRPAFPSFAPFLSQVDDLLTELDREARRAQHQQRQQRKRAFRARFDVRENQEGYEVQGDIPGFEQEHISIEVTDEHTLKITGNTETTKTSEQPAAPEQAPTEPQQSTEAEKTKDAEMDGVTLNEPETVESDTSSQKSYQATVEDDFEDLGAETSSTISEHYTPTEDKTPKEPKGKEKAVETTDNAEATVQPVAQPQSPTESQDRELVKERNHGSFERTFRFPERIDAGNVRAALRNGVLSITVPKAPAPTIRQITIQ